MIALIPMEIGPLATNQAAISEANTKIYYNGKDSTTGLHAQICTKNTKNIHVQRSKRTLHFKYIS